MRQKHEKSFEGKGIFKKRFHILITQNVLEFWFMVPAQKNELYEKMHEITRVSSSENRVRYTSFCRAYTIF